MYALLQAIDAKFAADPALVSAYPFGLQHDQATDPDSVPNIVRRVIAAPTTSSYGGVHRDAVTVRFTITGQGEDRTWPLVEAFDGKFNDTTLSLSTGQNCDCRRVHAPIPLVLNFERYAKMRFVQYTLTYLYTVRN